LLERTWQTSHQRLPPASGLAGGEGGFLLAGDIAQRLAGIAGGVLRIEARVAHAAVCVQRLQRLQGLIDECVGTEELACGFDIVGRGDEFRVRGHVDPVCAGVSDRWRRRDHVHLSRTGRVKHLNQVSRRGPANDGVIDHGDAPARDHRSDWVQLLPHEDLSLALRRHDEVASDVTFLGETAPVSYAECVGKGGSEEVAGGWNVYDHVGSNPGIAYRIRKSMPHTQPLVGDESLMEDRVLACEVDVLEHTERAGRLLSLVAMDPHLPVNEHGFAGAEISEVFVSKVVQARGFGCRGDVVVATDAEGERGDAVRIGERKKSAVGGNRDGRIRAWTFLCVARTQANRSSIVRCSRSHVSRWAANVYRSSAMSLDVSTRR